MINGYILFEKRRREGILMGRKRRWEDIKIDLKEIKFGCGGWIQRAQKGVQWRILSAR
jgi:hypothetical protein